MDSLATLILHPRPTLQDRSYNINETSKATGLSPSVLRIWELRYGWPNPKRRANGYRAYSQHLVNDLQLMAKLVRSGRPIRDLIIDGLPRWPTEDDGLKPRGLEQSKALPLPRQAEAARLMRDLIEAADRRHAGSMMELLQRSQWLVRPIDECRTALAPSVVALEEQRSLDRPVSGDDRVLASIAERCSQLLHRLPNGQQRSIAVQPGCPDQAALAGAAALLLRERGRLVELRDPDGADEVRLITRGKSTEILRALHHDGPSLVNLLGAVPAEAN